MACRGILKGDPRHGTVNGYGNHGCRCSPCREANTKYNAEWRHRTGYSKPLAVYLAELAARPVVHGIATTYKKRLCRCRVCRDWARDNKRRQRARHA